MYAGQISRRYATALADFAAMNGDEERVYAEAVLFAKLWRTHSRLREAMTSPVVKPEARVALLAGAVEGGVSATMMRFVELVVAHRREQFFDFIMHSYIALYKRRHNICDATIVTAAEVDDASLERIRASVEQSTRCSVNLHREVDPSLLGGFRFRVDDTLVDASLATQIERLKRLWGTTPHKTIIYDNDGKR